jgi:hypothetical protein
MYTYNIYNFPVYTPCTGTTLYNATNKMCMPTVKSYCHRFVFTWLAFKMKVTVPNICGLQK